MVLLSLAYLLLDRPMQRRFESDPAFRATDLLLQERVPKSSAIYPASGRGFSAPGAVDGYQRRHFACSLRPDACARKSICCPMALSRRGHRGGRRIQPLARSGRHAMARGFHTGLLGDVLLYARRRQRRVLVGGAAADGQAAHLRGDLFPGPAEFRRRDGEIETHMEISVSPEDDIELRRISSPTADETRGRSN